MPETRKKVIRIAKVAREINVGISNIVEHLRKKGFEVESRPSAKLSEEMYNLLLKDFRPDMALKKRAEKIPLHTRNRRDDSKSATPPPTTRTKKEEKNVEVHIKEVSAHKTPPTTTQILPNKNIPNTPLSEKIATLKEDQQAVVKEKSTDQQIPTAPEVALPKKREDKQTGNEVVKLEPITKKQALKIQAEQLTTKPVAKPNLTSEQKKKETIQPTIPTLAPKDNQASIPTEKQLVETKVKKEPTKQVELPKQVESLLKEKIDVPKPVVEKEIKPPKKEQPIAKAVEKPKETIPSNQPALPKQQPSGLKKEEITNKQTSNQTPKPPSIKVEDKPVVQKVQKTLEPISDIVQNDNNKASAEQKTVIQPKVKTLDKKLIEQKSTPQNPTISAEKTNADKQTTSSITTKNQSPKTPVKPKTEPVATDNSTTTPKKPLTPSKPSTQSPSLPTDKTNTDANKLVKEVLSELDIPTVGKPNAQKAKQKTSAKPVVSKSTIAKPKTEKPTSKETPSTQIDKPIAKKAKDNLPKEVIDTPIAKVNNKNKPSISNPKTESSKTAKAKDDIANEKRSSTKKTVAKADSSKTEPKEKGAEEPDIKRDINPEDYGVVGPKVVGKIDLSSINMRTRPDRKKRKRGGRKRRERETSRRDRPTTTPNEQSPVVNQSTTNADNNQPSEKGDSVERRKTPLLKGPKVVGKIDLSQTNKERKPSTEDNDKKKRKRKRIRREKVNPANKTRTTTGGDNRRQSDNRSRRDRSDRRKKQTKKETTEISDKEIQAQIKATLAKLSGTTANKGNRSRAKHRKNKRELAASRREQVQEQKNLLQLTEFISANELAQLMEIPITQLITTCFNMGVIVSINQRLDAELIELVTDEFGFEVEFISVTDQEEEEEIVDNEADLLDRPPIVTIMGHVDHGKTSLLDYIRRANVVAGEVGGITQHIGAYEVTTESGKQVTFLDTPGHEAFTAMRARGAKITDVAVIVVAADDSVMPQTKEAISHAQAAEVPMIFAINKIDKPDSDPERIKEQLSTMNILVEDWGGTYQSQEISAKKGLNIDDLLEKILLEAELLELKANPDREAVGAVVEASLDKGRGYVATVLVQTGTLRIGDVVLAGQYSGKVKAMFDERGKRVQTAGPSTPVLILGLDGAPQAGDRFKVMGTDQEARGIAQKRKQIIREQQQRANKHITLEEIGRRLALGNFKELNLIIKGDVDGSVEALADSLLKLSTEEIQVRIIHRAVGPIIESDVLLASASDAIIIGFQVRPTPGARRQAEKESIDIRLYSIIYDAIEEIESAMEGMLEPKVEERFLCNVEVRQTFKISKVGTIAGCYVSEGKIAPDTKIRLVRNGIVVYTGEIDSLRRYKDEVKEVMPGQECGISIKNFNDIKVGDFIEGYEEIEIKRKLRK